MSKDKSKILIISAVFPPEPLVSATLSRDISEQLAKKHDVTVLHPKPTRPAGFHFDLNKSKRDTTYNTMQTDSYVYPKSKILGRLRESLSFGKYAAEYIKNNYQQIDCIYANVWPLFAQIKIVLTAKKYNVPCVLHIQDVYPESLTKKTSPLVEPFLTKMLLPIDKIILKNSTTNIAISQSMITYLSKTRNVNQNKFKLVRNWQNDELFTTDISTKLKTNDQLKYMFLGSISPSANVQSIIKAFHLAKIPNAKLIIAGSGSDKDNCISLVNYLQNSQIEFCSLTSDLVPKLQSEADILLLPLKKGISKTATPSKITAYMFSGKPIIACVEEESDVANIIMSANCGLVIVPENEELLSKGMIQLSHYSNEELKQLGIGGRDFAIRNFSKKLNLEKMVSIIENTLHEN